MIGESCTATTYTIITLKQSWEAHSLSVIIEQVLNILLPSSFFNVSIKAIEFVYSQ